MRAVGWLFAMFVGVLSASEQFPPPMESGWSSNAESMYNTTVTRIRKAKTTVVVMEPLPPMRIIQPGKWDTFKGKGYDSGIWARVNGKFRWEPKTYANYRHYIDSGTDLVDFGTWVGVTVLYGAQLARRTLGIEADPVAFAYVEGNLKRNSDKPWYNRIALQPGCVGTQTDSVIMKSSEPGNSCSGIGSSVGCQKQSFRTFEWRVSCYSLDFLLYYYNLTVDQSMFIKIDIESFECKLLPALIDWLTGLESKPTIHVAMHSQIQSCSDVEYASINMLMGMYKYHSPFVHHGEVIMSDRKAPIH